MSKFGIEGSKHTPRRNRIPGPGPALPAHPLHQQDQNSNRLAVNLLVMTEHQHANEFLLVLEFSVEVPIPICSSGGLLTYLPYSPSKPASSSSCTFFYERAEPENTLLCALSLPHLSISVSLHHKIISPQPRPSVCWITVDLANRRRPTSLLGPRAAL